MYADEHFPLAQQPVHQLYGGAISAHVMTNLRDVSKVRPLGDNQEQFIDLQSGATMTFEIMKMGHQPLQDQILKELVELSVYDSQNLWIKNNNVQTKILKDNLILLTADQTVVSNGESINKKFILALYRFAQYNSDVLIYFSSRDDSQGHVQEFLQCLETFTINDPHLFG